MDLFATVEPMNCLIEDCSSDAWVRGWCSKHYQRWQTYGDPNYLKGSKADPVPRFWSYVNKTESCWNWASTTRGKGYGKFKTGGKVYSSHRYAYELVKGPVPPGLQLDHLCRNKLCVNPDHLEPVTNRENQLRRWKVMDY